MSGSAPRSLSRSLSRGPARALPRPARSVRTTFTVAVAVSALAACGAASSGTASGTAAGAASGAGAAAGSASGPRTAYPLTVDNCGQQVTIDGPPSRVLILNGTSVAEVESFIALGLERSIVANAQSYGVSDDPTMVAKIAAVPTGGLKLNKNFDVPAEQVLALNPDLVVSTWSGGFDAKQGFATREQLATAGIASLVNPVNCAYGKPDASAEEKAAYAAASVKSSFEFLTLLGQIFDVQPKATATVADLQARIDAVQAKVTGRPAKKVLIAYPGMSMMTANGVPAVFAGGVYDDVIRLAGGVNSFEGKDNEFVRNLNTEALSAAQVDLLATGVFTAQEKPEEEAAKILAAFPNWAASKNKAFVTVSDGVYLGPLNALAIEKIAKAVHPDAF